MNGSTWSRRGFVAASAGLGYSVLVKAPPAAAAPPAQASDPAVLGGPMVEGRAASAGGDGRLTRDDLEADVVVAGGGMAGVCAALAAAREGAKVILVQDRSRLGGNASSEVRMHIVGADCHGNRKGWREGGILEELRLDDAVQNPQWSWELWDLLLYDKCMREPNLRLLLDTAVVAADVRGGLIREARARCEKTEHLYALRAPVYLDCTGDSRLAYEAGAEFRVGREEKTEFGESLAYEKADRRTQGSSILFTAREHDRPMPFTPPPWARKIGKEHLKFRGVGSWEYGYWWIELGGMYDTIRDHEKLRFELLSVVLGVWDYIKNSGNQPTSANWALETVGMVPGKRESRRVLGDFILTQADLEAGWEKFPDAVAIGGWGMDEHPPAGFDDPSVAPYKSTKLAEVYNIPFGSLYSRTIGNLLLAGRNISCSHVAFTSTRVMATCSVVGQAAGTAAAYAVRHRVKPRDIRSDAARMRELQQILLRHDQSIRLVRNEDPADLARKAKVAASGSVPDAKPESILSGETRDLPEQWKHRWGGPMGAGPAWIELQWDAPPVLRHVQLCFDTGFQRQLTHSASAHVRKTCIRGPQPETVKDYTLSATAADGKTATLAEVKGNYQRLRRHEFPPQAVKALRLTVHATNGAAEARVYEIRAYG